MGGVITGSLPNGQRAQQPLRASSSSATLAASAARVSAPSRSVGVTAFNPPAGCECSRSWQASRSASLSSPYLNFTPPAPSARHGASRRCGWPRGCASLATRQHGIKGGRSAPASLRGVPRRPRHAAGFESGIRSCDDWLVLPPCPLASTCAAALPTDCPCHSRSARIGGQPARYQILTGKGASMPKQLRLEIAYLQFCKPQPCLH